MEISNSTETGPLKKRIADLEIELAGLKAEMDQRVEKRTRILEAVVREQKQNTALLELNEARYRALFQESPVPMWEEDFSQVHEELEKLRRDGVRDIAKHFDDHPDLVLDLSQRILVTDINDRALEIQNLEKREDALGPLHHHLEGEELLGFRNNFISLFEGNRRYSTQTKLWTPAGRLDVTLDMAIAQGFEDSWSKVFVSAQDVTRLLQAEDAIVQNESRLKTLYNNMSMGVYRTDMDGHILFANPAMARILGYKTWKELKTADIHRDGFKPERNTKEWRKLLLAKGTVTGLVSEWQRRDGTRISVRESSHVIYDSEEKPLYIEGTVEDVTDLVTTQRNLQEFATDLSLINALNEHILSGDSFKEVQDTLIRQVLQSFHVNGVLVYLLSEDGRELISKGRAFNRHGYTFIKKILKTKADEVRIQLDQAPPFFDRVLKGEEPYIRLDEAEEILNIAMDSIPAITKPGSLLFKTYQKFMKKVIAGLGITSSVTFPLKAQDTVFGLFSLTADRPFRESEISRLQQLVAQFSLLMIRQRSQQTIQQLYQAIDASREVVFMTNRDGVFTYVNPEFTRLYGYQPEEVLGKHTPRLLKSSQQPQEFYEEMWSEILDGRTFSDDILNLNKAGDLIPVYSTISPVEDEEGQLNGFIAIQRDLTALRSKAEALTRSETLYESLFNYGYDAIFIARGDKVMTCNTHAAEMFRGKQEDIIGMEIWGLMPDSQPGGESSRGFPTQYYKLAMAGTPQRFEWRLLRLDGVEFDAEVSLVAIEVGDESYVQGAVRDITLEKQAKRKMEESIREKEVLLREVHHRVKNNMQVIQSLLNMQADSVKNPELDNYLSDARNRIMSMSLVHERLYQLERFSRIDLRDYIQSLALALYHSMNRKPEQIKLKLELERLELDLDRAVPVGLILNELITNSLKYAFPGDRSGTILITLKQQDPAHILLAVQDDGVGLPEKFDPEKASSLGVRLIYMLGRDQLQGELTLNRTQGTGFQFVLPTSPQQRPRLGV